MGLAFVSVPQSALFVQEAPARTFGSVTAFRTTTGQLGVALSSSVLSHDKGVSAKVIEVITNSYASGLVGTMLMVALFVALLGAISLLLLVIGRQQSSPQT